MHGSIRSHTLFVLAASCLLSALCRPAEAQIRFNLPPQSLAQALTTVGSLANLNIYFDPPLVKGIQAPALNATLDADEAIARLLAGTHLHIVRVNDSTLRVVEDAAPKRAETQHGPPTGALYAPSGVRLAEADPTSLTTTSATSDNPADLADPDKNRKDHSPVALEEVVVTGTNIRGVTDTASPRQVYTRSEIDRTGAGTAQQFLEKLPQNFGSISENTISTVAGPITTGNATSASAVNLRGLGSDSTLLLVNGHRVATGGLNGDIADVSLIPLSAIDRIEIVSDGASAVYGSDAVGGVVNVILRKDFEGIETRARYGAVSDGGSHESQVGQSFGTSWGSGSAALSYEYLDRSALDAAAREFSRDAIEPTNLLPQQLRHGAFATIEQDVGSNLSLFADGTYSHRDTDQYISAFGYSQQDRGVVRAYSGTVGGRAQLAGSNEVEVSTSYASSRTDLQTFDSRIANGGIPRASFAIDTGVLSVDGKLDGTLDFPNAAKASYALGAQFRRESLDSSQAEFPFSSASKFNPHRNIGAAFAELRIPLLTRSAQIDPALQLSLADRYEHYSDFGSTNNPQIGLIWEPAHGIKLRGTAGTSFKAPLLTDLNPVPSQIVVLPESDPALGSRSCVPFDTTNTCSNAIIINGGNPDLTAEKARTWTVGVDVRPSAVPGLLVSATYYDLYSRSRITNPNVLFPLTAALRNEAVLGSTIVQRNPTPARVEQLASSSSFINPFGIDLAAMDAVVDYRERNLSSVRTSGLDLNATFRVTLPVGEFESGLDGTYIFKFASRVTPGTSDSELLNTPFNPIDLRLRAHVGFQRGPVSTAVFVNFSDSYEDNRGALAVPVASWTTADMNAAYACSASCGILQDATVRVGVQNLANRAPPYLRNALGYGVNFDGTNANALGRFLYLQISTKW